MISLALSQLYEFLLQKRNWDEESTDLLLLYDELIFDDVDDKTTKDIIENKLLNNVR